MTRSCRYCGGVHKLGEVCPLAPPKWASEAKRGGNRSRANAFRSTNAWTEKSAEIKRRDGSLCRVCLAAGRLTYKGLETHHIIPIEQDYDKRLDDDNLITLCREHHRQAERGDIPARKLLELIENEKGVGDYIK